MCSSHSILSAIFFFLEPSPLPSSPRPWDGLSFLLLWLIHLPWWRNPTSKSLLLSLLQASSGSPYCRIFLYVSPSLPQWDKSAFISLILRSLCYSNCCPSPFLLFCLRDWVSSLKLFFHFHLGFQAGSHHLHGTWLPLSSIPWLPKSTVFLEGHQQNLHSFYSLGHTKWKSFSSTELLVNVQWFFRNNWKC